MGFLGPIAGIAGSVMGLIGGMKGMKNPYIDKLGQLGGQSQESMPWWQQTAQQNVGAASGAVLDRLGQGRFNDPQAWNTFAKVLAASKRADMLDPTVAKSGARLAKLAGTEREAYGGTMQAAQQGYENAINQATNLGQLAGSQFLGQGQLAEGAFQGAGSLQNQLNQLNLQRSMALGGSAFNILKAIPGADWASFGKKIKWPWGKQAGLSLGSPTGGQSMFGSLAMPEIKYPG